MTRIRRIALAAAALPTLAGCGSAAIPAASPHTAPASPPSGPFKVKLSRCTGAEAFVVVTNTGRAGATVQVSVNFVHGATVQDGNTSGFSDPLRPGQSERLVVQNVAEGATGSYGPGSPSDTCDLTGYAAQTLDGQLIGTWTLAGGRP